MIGRADLSAVESGLSAAGESRLTLAKAKTIEGERGMTKHNFNVAKYAAGRGDGDPCARIRASALVDRRLGRRISARRGGTMRLG